MNKTVLKASSENIAEGIEFIRENLANYKANRKEIAQVLLSTEEILVGMVQHAKDPKAKISIGIRSFPGKISLRIRCPGQEFKLEDLENNFRSEEETDPENESIIRGLMNQVLYYNVRLKNSRGINICEIGVHKSRYQQLINIMAGLLLGIAAGLILKYVCPGAVAAWLGNNLFGTFSAMFMNALKMLVGPLVFFSIAASIAQFPNLASLGRIAIKVCITCVFTSLIAIGVGCGVYHIFPIGSTEMAAAVTDAANTAIQADTATTISVRDIIMGIVPSNIVDPFAKGDMLQIIFIAILVGAGVSAVSGYHAALKNAVSGLNDLISRIIGWVIAILPLSVFCAMAKMVIETEVGNLTDLILWIPVCYAGDLVMLIVYGLLIMFVVRLNPLHFFRGYFPAMLTAFSLASSNASMPILMKTCEKLGISRKIYSFSLPLAPTIDGSCIVLTITAFFMAKIFGVTMTPLALLLMFTAIIILSLGAPDIPNSGLVCLAVLLPQLGIPAEAVSLIMGLYPLVDMGESLIDVGNDVTMATVVAKQENLLDMEQFLKN